MRRLVISLGLLALLAGLGLWNCSCLERRAQFLADTLTQAQVLAEAGDWTAAEQSTRLAQQDWEQMSGYLSIVLCHSATDQVNAGFQQVLALLQWQEAPEYTAANQMLVAQVRHLSESEQPSWRNLL